MHVLAALDRQAEDVGQDLEHVGLRDFAHGIDRLALAGAQAAEQLAAHAFRRSTFTRSSARGLSASAMTLRTWCGAADRR